MDRATTATATSVVDLVAIAAGARACVRWYDRYGAGEDPSWIELAGALDQLRAAGPIPGRLGDAAAVLLDPPPEASSDDILAALDQMRVAARVAHHEPGDRSVLAPAPAPPRRRRGIQLQLSLEGEPL